MNGKTVQVITQPDHALYHGQDAMPYIPTWTAQHPVTGEIWLADGYGASLLHRFSAKGELMQSYDGSEGAGRFACPHGINFRTTPAGHVELFITDRGNKRTVVYDDNGNLLRQTNLTHSSCCFDFLRNCVLIPELLTGAKVLNADSLAFTGRNRCRHLGGQDARLHASAPRRLAQPRRYTAHSTRFLQQPTRRMLCPQR